MVVSENVHIRIDELVHALLMMMLLLLMLLMLLMTIDHHLRLIHIDLHLLMLSKVFEDLKHNKRKTIRMK